MRTVYLKEEKSFMAGLVFDIFFLNKRKTMVSFGWMTSKDINRWHKSKEKLFKTPFFQVEKEYHEKSKATQCGLYIGRLALVLMVGDRKGESD